MSLSIWTYSFTWDLAAEFGMVSPAQGHNQLTCDAGLDANHLAH